MLTPAELDLAKLSSEVADLEIEAERLEKTRVSLAIAAASLSFQAKSLRFIQWIRHPAKTIESWPVIAMVNGSLVAGGLVLLFIGLIYGTWDRAVFGMFLGTCAGVGLIAILLFVPSDAILSAAIPEAVAKARIRSASLQDTIVLLHVIKQRLHTRRSEHDELLASGKLQREKLLQRNWRDMRGNEWEDYLIEVCCALGANVRRTAGVGDQGVDLIVDFESRSLAVQAKGYGFPVGNSAVQEAVAGVAHYRCNASAVITNSRFTKGAKELAVSNRCILIGEDEFADFVLGKISIWA